MTDKELLELAAKAAGMPPPYDANDVFTAWISGKDPHSEYGHWWDPLNDDGDALRLAVKLQLQVTPGTYNADEFTAFHAGKGESGEFRSYLQDDFASTRRAIVRAAAKIGEPSA